MSSPATTRLYLDLPTTWKLPSRHLVVRGWCFRQDGQRLRGIRLVLGELIVPGVVGLPRPDVVAAIPEAGHPETGFEIRAVVPSTTRRAAIEGSFSDEDWTRLFETEADVNRFALPLWLGGGDNRELVAFQLPAHPRHPPRAVRAERFPGPASAPAARPRVTVVTPSFNQARFLGETVGSVLDATGVAVDYVVQDGGSSDGSAHLIARAAAAPVATTAPAPAPRLVAWASEPDAGQADAIAKGFAKTSGGPDDLMAWINSDDFYLPGALAFVADWMARHPEVDVVYGHRILVDEQSREVGRWFLPKHDDEVLRLNDFVPQETMFWRRRIWDKVGGLDSSLQFAMDWDLLLRFQAAGARIVRLPYFLACFRLHAAQKTSAAMHHTGQAEIDRLRTRTHGREIPPAELENHPRLLRYLRRSAFIEWLWSLGIRAR